MSDVPQGQSDLIFRAIAEAADNARLGVSITSLDGDEVEVLFLNSAVLHLLGTDEATVRARGIWSFIAPDELPRLMEMHAARARGDDLPNVFGTVVLRPDGERLPVEISTSRVTLGSKLANVTFVSDVSALSRSEARFTQVVEAAPDGVVILRWPHIVFMNLEAARMLGLSDPGDAIGKALTDYLEPSEAQLADQRAREHAGDTEWQRAPREYTGRDAAGNRLVVEVSSIAIEYEGEPAMLAFARDVTERNAMSTKLARADKLAAVGTLAAGVSHEINNPLGYLLLNLDMLRRELPRTGLPSERVEALMARLDECKHGAERVKTIVRDLQAFTRKDEDIRGPVDLAQVIGAATQLARHQLAPSASITHEFDDLPPAHGNETRFEQLILNLLINAAHAIEEAERVDGAIHVSATRGRDGQLLVRVRDNGVGMSAELQAHVFEPFFTTKPPGVGTGLGLAMCHTIARAVGGDVTLESSVGEGTTVTVELPAHGSTEASGTATSAAEPQPPGQPQRRRARVLLIDDERAVVASLSAALDDHKVVSCAKASDARELLDRGDTFDVILCDLMLRGETGMDLYRHATAQRPELRERFVFMTGGAYLPEAQEFLERVGCPYLEKPFELAALRRVFDQLLA